MTETRASERCRCGHTGSAHIGGFQGCAACPCIRFTWVPPSEDVPLRTALQRAVVRSDSALERAHDASMNAKEAVFIAQDVCSAGWERASIAQKKELRKIEKRLARVRAELEALDRAVLSAKCRGVT